MPVSTVATVLTVYGIETCSKHPTRRFVFLISRNSTYRLRYWNSLKNILLISALIRDCRNSTYRLRYWNLIMSFFLFYAYMLSRNSTYRLWYWNLLSLHVAHSDVVSQQYLPFTVLKLTDLVNPRSSLTIESQQYLPFTVLKLFCFCFFGHSNHYDRRNSTYRLRYWNETLIAFLH